MLPKGHTWYENYINIPGRETHCNENGMHVFSANLVADILIPLLRSKYRYEPYAKIWYSFQATHWQEYNGLYSVLRNVIAEMKVACQGAKGAPQYVLGLAKAHGNNFTEAVISTLEKDDQMQIHPTAFDAHPGLLNTPDGIYDLLTGECATNAPNDFCRQITTVAPLDDEDGAMCPRYLAHIKFMADGDEQMAQYLEELSGYVLTGETFQQEFYWFHGLPSTGKSSLAAVWLHILNPDGYGCMATQAQFAETYSTPHPEQDMRLIGKRLVFVDELKGKFDEAKLKSFTSGNPVVAREMHGKSISYMPVCKLLFTSNNKPPIDGGDGGIGRRIKIFPFSRQIDKDMRIKDFDKVVLRAEAPYILFRMMANAQRVLERRGLVEVEKVELASSAYMHANDLLAQFIMDCCTTDKYDTENTKNIFSAFSIWCGESGYDCPSQNKFGRMLNDAAYDLVRISGRYLRSGIKVRPEWNKKVELRAQSAYN